MEERWAYEKGLWEAGHTHLAGIDEAGRGPLAGPVVAAAAILPRTFRHEDIKDSKLLSAGKREDLALIIEEHAVSWAVASADEREIEHLNILQAARLAMGRAVRALTTRPDYLLVDAVLIPDMEIPQRPLIKGDRLSATIAAASILAKVARDRIMADYHKKYPRYRFDRHKGYGTAAHRQAIRDHGPCEVHRRTFRGVKEYLPGRPSGEPNL